MPYKSDDEEIFHPVRSNVERAGNMIWSAVPIEAPISPYPQESIYE